MSAEPWTRELIIRVLREEGLLPEPNGQFSTKPFFRQLNDVNAIVGEANRPVVHYDRIDYFRVRAIDGGEWVAFPKDQVEIVLKEQGD